MNDEFAKDVSDATTLDELKKKVHEGLEHERDHIARGHRYVLLLSEAYPYSGPLAQVDKAREPAVVAPPLPEPSL